MNEVMYWARKIDDEMPLNKQNLLLLVKIEEGSLSKTQNGNVWSNADEYADLLIGGRIFEGEFIEQSQAEEYIKYLKN